MTRPKQYGLIIGTVGDQVGIRNISEQEVNRFIKWMEDENSFPMFSSECRWDGKPTKKFVVKRMICWYSVEEETHYK